MNADSQDDWKRLGHGFSPISTDIGIEKSQDEQTGLDHQD